MDARVTLSFQWVGGYILLLYTGLFFAGCASPGTPKPPSLHLPEVVTNLTAERVGETVRLRWTTPSKTTDGLNVEGMVTAQLCRHVPGVATVCLPVRRLGVVAGPSETVDVLPLAMRTTKGAMLEYRVELLNTKERSAGLSSPVLAAGGAAPPEVANLQAEATRTGALVRWRAEDAADVVELERLQVSPAAKPGQRSVDVGSAPRVPASVRLRVDYAGLTAPFVSDAGGMMDRTAARGESYVYTAQRVRRVVLDGQALELHSAISPPVTVTMRDVFPPQAPTGVEAIAGKAGGVLGIDLSWTPNTEDDLAGYIVFRRENNEADEVRLTPALTLKPAFRDVSVATGHTYVYTVRAVDRTGNQSVQSAPTQETTPLF